MDISMIVSFLSNFIPEYWYVWVLLVLLSWAAISLIALDYTFLHFAAIMRFRKMRDEEGFTPQSDPFLWKCAMAVTVRGILADHWVRMFVCPVIGLELPPLRIRTWKGIPYLTTEWLTTDVLRRWHKLPNKGWWTINVKKRFAMLGAMLLDPVDTTKKHVEE